MTGHLDDAPGHARAAARLDPGSVNRWIGLLAPLVPANLGLAALIQALVTLPDQPDSSSNRTAQPILDAAHQIQAGSCGRATTDTCATSGKGAQRSDARVTKSLVTNRRKRPQDRWSRGRFAW